MEKALEELIILVESGVEYPEAHSHICATYLVDGDELSTAYDEYYYDKFAN